MAAAHKGGLAAHGKLEAEEEKVGTYLSYLHIHSMSGSKLFLLPFNSFSIDTTFSSKVTSSSNSEGKASKPMKAKASPQNTGNTNPGNFANRPHEEVVAAAHKGGHAAHGIVEDDKVIHPLKPLQIMLLSLRENADLPCDAHRPPPATPIPETSPIAPMKRW